MNALRFLRILFVLMVFVVPGYALAKPQTPVTINKIEPSAVQNTLVISGVGFLSTDPAGNPTTISLSGYATPLAHGPITDTSVTVMLPTGVFGSGYAVTVAYGTKEGEFDQLPIMLGATGPQGSQGPMGLTGLQGATGPAGPQGLQGAKGSTGITGSQGIPGIKGDTGATGAQGLKGDTGANGLQGAQGNKGDTGATGAQGPLGLTGPIGLQGAQGIKGDTGVTGAQGPLGLTGLIGLQGVLGLKGDTGATGSQGIQGFNGDTGAQGPSGPVGPAGPSGANGVTFATPIFSVNPLCSSPGTLTMNSFCQYGDPAALSPSSCTVGCTTTTTNTSQVCITYTTQCNSYGCSQACSLYQTLFNNVCTCGNVALGSLVK